MEDTERVKITGKDAFFNNSFPNNSLDKKNYHEFTFCYIRFQQCKILNVFSVILLCTPAVTFVLLLVILLYVYSWFLLFAMDTFYICL